MTDDSIFDPLIARGSILIYRVYDVSDEIDLKLLETIFQEAQGRSRLRISRGAGQALVMRNPPVRLALGETVFRLKDRVFRADTFATVWDYGVISIVFQVPIEPGTRWSELVQLAPSLSGEQPGEEIDSAARRRAQELIHYIAPALTSASEWRVFEDYVIYFFERLDNAGSLANLVRKGMIPELILGEFQERLAHKSRAEIEDLVLQYAENDLVAIDWNSAVVIEPAGNRDIPDVIEFALTHLLEFRYYDDLLDQRLSSVYDAVDISHESLLKRRNFAQVSREANARFIEISEFLERIDNSLKVVGDFYLAVIFRAAVRRFRIPDWQVSIRRKMNLLAQVSQLLLGEANARRGHVLEGIIILLIAFEIVSAILKANDF